jgi:hypothetical protein
MKKCYTDPGPPPKYMTNSNILTSGTIASSNSMAVVQYDYKAMP